MKPVDHYRTAITAFRAHQYVEAINILSTLWTHLEPLEESVNLKPFLSLEDFLSQLVNIPEEEHILWQRDLFFECGLLMAICFKKMKDLPSSISILLKIEAHYSQSLQLTHLIARYLALNHNYEDAILYLTKLLRMSPEYDQAYQDLAWISNQTGNYKETIQIIQKALLIAPSEILFEYLMIALAGLDDLEAIENTLLELSLQYLNETTFNILLKITQRLYQKKDYKKTIALSEHLLAFNPIHQECLNLLVLSLLKTGQVSRACFYLLKAINRSETSPENWFKLGVAYKQWDMPLFARHALAKCLEVLPENNELYKQCLSILNSLSISIDLEGCIKSIIKRCSLDREFSTQLNDDIQGTLQEYGISCTSELMNMIKKMKPHLIRKVN